MKNLLEGCWFLDTDVKNKSKMQIIPAPVIINLNGSSLSSVFKWCLEDIPAFKSKCFFLKMCINLKHRIDETDIHFSK